MYPLAGQGRLHSKKNNALESFQYGEEKSRNTSRPKSGLYDLFLFYWRHALVGGRHVVKPLAAWPAQGSASIFSVEIWTCQPWTSLECCPDWNAMIASAVSTWQVYNRNFHLICSCIRPAYAPNYVLDRRLLIIKMSRVGALLIHDVLISFRWNE